jgi:hypothetical protein
LQNAVVDGVFTGEITIMKIFSATLFMTIALAWCRVGGAQTIASPVHQRVHAKVERELLVKAVPDAICDVQMAGAQSGASQKAFTDGYGIARIGIYAEEVALNAKLTLSCRGQKGEGPVVSVPIEVTSVHDGEPVGADTDYLAALPPFGKHLPPLVGDPSSYSAEYLRNNGYPPRPDGPPSSKEHQDWVAQVTRPLTIAPLTLIPNPNVFNASCAQNWDSFALKNAPCGSASGYSSPVWWYVTGEWNVAATTYPTSTNTTYGLSQWVGIGGTNNSSALAQTGTQRIIRCNGGICTVTNSVWVEYLCSANLQPQLVIGGMTASTGDAIAAAVTMTDAYQNRSKYGPYAYMSIRNATTGVLGWGFLALPSGCTVVGEAAEWVFERPMQGTSLLRLPNFGTGQISYAFGKSADANSSAYCSYEQRLTPSTTNLIDYMYGATACGGNLLANNSYGGSNTHGSYFNYAWKNYY